MRADFDAANNLADKLFDAMSPSLRSVAEDESEKVAA
jgi:hypothetical protein